MIKLKNFGEKSLKNKCLIDVNVVAFKLALFFLEYFFSMQIGL
jgi:hypothetical protein